MAVVAVALVAAFISRAVSAWLPTRCVVSFLAAVLYSLEQHFCQFLLGRNGHSASFKELSPGIDAQDALAGNLEILFLLCSRAAKATVVGCQDIRWTFGIARASNVRQKVDLKHQQAKGCLDCRKRLIQAIELAALESKRWLLTEHPSYIWASK
jgi:hypothetical protein